jgi:hypothetical protein
VDERYQTTVPGIFAAGNVLHVHDLVDFVSMEAEALADGVVCFLKGGLTESNLSVTGDAMVGQLVPARISGTEDVTISFRVRKPLRGCTVELWQNEILIKKVKQPKALPAEMIQIKVKAEQLNQTDDLEVRIVC